MAQSAYTALETIYREGHLQAKPLLLVTLVHSGGETLRQAMPADLSSTELAERLRAGGFPIETLMPIQQAAKAKKPVSLCTDAGSDGAPWSYHLVVETLQPRRSLLIFGAGHVGKALAQAALLVGYEVSIADDRADFLSLQRFPERQIRRLHMQFEDTQSLPVIGAHTAIAIVTRGHQHDEACLRAVLRTKAAYLGMIGSRRRVQAVFERLHQQGFSRAETDRVFAPIGLPIGASTPEEIAVAILAQIIQVMNN